MLTSIAAFLGGAALIGGGTAYLTRDKIKDWIKEKLADIIEILTNYTEKALENACKEGRPPDKQIERIKETIKNFFEKNYNKIENLILMPHIVKPIYDGLKDLANGIESTDKEAHKKLKEFINDENNKKEIKDTAQKLAYKYILDPMLDYIEKAINDDFSKSKEESSENEEEPIFEKIKKRLEEFKKNNLEKIKKKLKDAMADNPSLNNLASITIPDAEIEKIRAFLDLIRMDYVKNSLLIDPKDSEIMSFDLAKYHIIGDLASYNNKNTSGIDPLINSSFKGQTRINNFIIKNLNVYIAEKNFLKKYYKQLEKFTITNHEKFLTDILSSLKKMYNVLYVIQKKIENVDRFSSKKAFAHYLNSYTYPGNKKITKDDLPGNIKTWDDYIKSLKDIIENTLKKIKEKHIKTVSELIKDPDLLDSTINPSGNIDRIKKILECYLDPKKIAKKTSTYTTNKKGIKKVFSKTKNAVKLQINSYAKNAFTSTMLDARMLLCPDISKKTYLGFKFAKDAITFLKEYNNISDSITKIWFEYVDIPKQVSINKKLINQLEKYRSIKYTLEKTLKAKEVSPKKLINAKIDLKKNLDKIEKICKIPNIGNIGWKNTKLDEARTKLKEKGLTEVTKEKMTLITQTFDFMTKNCQSQTSMLWEEYITEISKIAQNTIKALDTIIALKDKDKDKEIKMDFDALEMKKFDYKVLMKKDLDKQFDENTNEEDLFKKDRYKENITVDIGNKNFEKMAKSLETKCDKQTKQIETLDSKKDEQFTYHNNLLTLLGIITINEDKAKTESATNAHKVIEEFQKKYEEIRGKYTPYDPIDKPKNSNSTPSIEYTLNLKNKINNQIKYISQSNKLLKKIIKHNNGIAKTILDMQKDIKKHQNKYNSAYKAYKKYCDKHKINFDLPTQTNDIFVNLGKIDKDTIKTNLDNTKKQVETAKNLLDDLDNLIKDKDKKIKHDAYKNYLRNYVNFIVNKVKEKTAT